MATGLSPDPQTAFDNIVAGTEAWAAQQNKSNADAYNALWPSYLAAVQLAESRNGQNMPPQFYPSLMIRVSGTSVSDMMANKPAVTILYGLNPTDYCTPPNKLPIQPIMNGGVGVHQGDSLWYSALPGDGVADNVVVHATSADGVTGDFMKHLTPWGGVYYRIG